MLYCHQHRRRGLYTLEESLCTGRREAHPLLRLGWAGPLYLTLLCVAKQPRYAGFGRVAVLVLVLTIWATGAHQARRHGGRILHRILQCCIEEVSSRTPWFRAGGGGFGGFGDCACKLLIQQPRDLDVN